MKCPRCGSENVKVELAENSAKTKKKGNGFGGHINNTARGLTAIGTLGLSNLFWKKSKKEQKKQKLKTHLLVYVRIAVTIGKLKTTFLQILDIMQKNKKENNNFFVVL